MPVLGDLHLVVVVLYMVVGSPAEEQPLTLSPIQTFSPGSPFSSLTPTKKSFSRPKSAEVSMNLHCPNIANIQPS